MSAQWSTSARTSDAGNRQNIYKYILVASQHASDHPSEQPLSTPHPHTGQPAQLLPSAHSAHCMLAHIKKLKRDNNAHKK